MSKAFPGVGDRVKLRKATRHGMIAAGSVGVVTELRSGGVAPGICVRFMRKPSPHIASIFGLDPNREEPYECLFLNARNLEPVTE